jgi:cell division protein FtsI (penicillin-binding protein 3)
MAGAFSHAGSAPTEYDTSLRLVFVMGLFAAAFIAAGIGATNAALFSRKPSRAIGPAAVSADRADLVDRRGSILATDIVRYGLYVRPAEIDDKAGAEAAILAAAPAISRTELEGALAGRERGRPARTARAQPRNPILAAMRRLLGRPAGETEAPNPTKEFFVASGLTPATREKLHDLALPGLDFEEESGRYYPLGHTGAHVIGYDDKDGRGLAGAERAFDAQLRAEGGRDAQALSIDLRVQAALQDELETSAAHFGVKDAVGMVVNVRTGEILALASYPVFNPAAPSPPEARDPAMINHAAASVYEPGSVFKVFTLAMGLDTGKVDVDTVFDVCSPLVLPGQIIHDYDKGDCSLPLWQVFTHSSNIGAAKMALRVGGDAEERYFRAFGLFERAPSELAESAHPLTPKKATQNTVATMAFGHDISVSPLALATGMTAILDGGVYRPLTLHRLDPAQPPAPGRRVIQASTSRAMLDLMRRNALEGTGRNADAQARGCRLGGKTGSATKLINGRYNHEGINLASFAAVFPTDGPLERDRYYVLVMMDEPRRLPETGGFTTGGVVAAPIAGRIIARIAPFVGVDCTLAAGDRAPAAPVDPATLGGAER